MYGESTALQALIFCGFDKRRMYVCLGCSEKKNDETYAINVYPIGTNNGKCVSVNIFSLFYKLCEKKMPFLAVLFWSGVRVVQINCQIYECV